MKGNPSVTPMDILNNLLLLFPIGVMLPIVYPSIKWGRLLAGSLIISLSIESLQYFLNMGTAQLDDIVHNTLGCLAGAFLVKRVLAKKVNTE